MSLIGTTEPIKPADFVQSTAQIGEAKPKPVKEKRRGEDGTQAALFSFIGFNQYSYTQ